MSCDDDNDNELELKGMDTTLTINIGGVVATTSTNEAAFCLNLMDPGFGPYQRVGEYASLKSLLIRLTAICRYAPAADGGGMVANLLRAVVVWDKNPNAPTNLPTFGQIFGRTFQDGSEGLPRMSEVRYNAAQRFEVLSEHTMLSSPKMYYPAGDLSRASETIHFWEDEINLDGLETVYTGTDTSSTIENIYSEALYLYVSAWVNTSEVSQWYLPNLSWCRLRYKDV